MKKIKYLLFLLALVLTGCGKSTPSATLVGDPMDVNKIQIYYNPIDKKLVKFNPNGNTSEILNGGDSLFAYDINNADNLFVMGDSLNHKYKLVEVKDGEIDTVFDFPENQEIFPIGYSADNIYFIHSFYENGSEIRDKRTISAINLTSKEISNIESISGLLTDGIVSPNNIYYTSFNNENNYYELYKKSIEVGKKSEPTELISVGYETADLYLTKDLIDEKEYISLYASDKNRIYSKDDSWPKYQENYFRPATMIGIDDQGDGMMKITIIDKRNRDITNEINDVVGIRFEGDILVVATNTGASKY